MIRPPRAARSPIVDREMQVGVLLIGAVMAGATLLSLDMKLPGGLIEGTASVTEARTVAFTVLVLGQLFNCFNSRSERTSAFRGLFKRALPWLAVGVSLLLQVLVVTVPALNIAFDSRPLSGRDWLSCVTMASSTKVQQSFRADAARCKPCAKAARSSPKMTTAPAEGWWHARCNKRGMFKGLNTWKMAATLFLLAAFVGVLLLGPVLRKAPDPGPPADVPAMSNVPPPGSLHIEQP